MLQHEINALCKELVSNSQKVERFEIKKKDIAASVKQIQLRNTAIVAELEAGRID